MLKIFLFSPLYSAPFFCFSLFLSFFQRCTTLSFFCLCFSPSLLLQPSFSFLLVHVCPFFQPKNILFNPKQFSLQPKNIFFSPNVFQFFSFSSAQTFFALVQPLFSSSFFLLYSFLAQPSFFSFSASFFSFL